MNPWSNALLAECNMARVVMKLISRKGKNYGWPLATWG